VTKDKRHEATLNPPSATPNLDAILEESRSLRRQMADDLSTETQKLRQMSRHIARSRRSTDTDEQSA
jgi:hypothetical protein